MQLYTFFRSSTSFRLRIALAYKGMPYEARYTSLPKMEHASPAYRKVNPQGLVPALVDDAGKVFTQSMAMIEYLDDIKPEPALMPKSPEEKWYVRAVSQILGCEIHPLNNVRVLKYLKSAYGLTDDQVNKDWYPHWIAEGLAGLEAFLVDQQRCARFCLGNQFTMASASTAT
jgi:maleylacetoacetate isomerase